MRKTYGACIRILFIVLLTVIFLGVALTGCVVKKEESNEQNSVKIDPPTSEVQQTTAPVAEEPNLPTETYPCNPTEPDSTQPTDPEVTVPATGPTETVPSTEPDEPTEPTSPTEPSSPTDPVATEPPVKPGNGVTYLEYYAMSAEQQQAFIDSFDSLDAFFAWHTAAMEEYESGRTPIDGGTLNP